MIRIPTEDEPVEIIHGDCLDVLRALPDECVDAVITDPPYGLAFMNKRWDYDVPSVEMWAECLRALKPGGHLLAFAGTRTQHRMAVRIEDAGFEIRDMIAWVYGSGFPKSLGVSKAIDKAAGAEREVVGSKLGQPGYSLRQNDTDEHTRKAYGNFTDAEAECAITAPATDAARQWQGWGTALKPALEPITVARKPLIGTVAENVMEYGTGGLNIDECRVEAGGEDMGDPARWDSAFQNKHKGWHRPSHSDDAASYAERRTQAIVNATTKGRWPANLIHDGSDEVLAGFPITASNVRKPSGKNDRGVPGFVMRRVDSDERGHNDTGSAARFFYCAKANKSDRGIENKHPTVKPVDLMRYLCRLVTASKGIILDPFGGSGTTAVAAIAEGRRCIVIEKEAAYVEIIRQRVDKALCRQPGSLFAAIPPEKP